MLTQKWTPGFQQVQQPIVGRRCGDKPAIGLGASYRFCSGSRYASQDHFAMYRILVIRKFAFSIEVSRGKWSLHECA